jgi:hypothetical protein
LPQTALTFIRHYRRTLYPLRDNFPSPVHWICTPRVCEYFLSGRLVLSAAVISRADFLLAKVWTDVQVPLSGVYSTHLLGLSLTTNNRELLRMKFWHEDNKAWVFGFRLLGLQIRIPPGAWMSVSWQRVCCQVEVSQSGWSPVEQGCGVGTQNFWLRLLHKVSKTFHHHHVNHQTTFLTYNLYLSISLMVIVDIRALNLEYLYKILNWSLNRSRYIFTDSDST